MDYPPGNGEALIERIQKRMKTELHPVMLTKFEWAAIVGLCHNGIARLAEVIPPEDMFEDLRVQACHKLCNALGLEDEALAVLEENKPSNGDNMITTLKGFTDKKLQRHYYPEHEEWEVSECSNQIKFDMAGQAEIFIDRDEAADLAKLFADFAKHGTFRVPRNQEPSKTSNGELP